MLHPVPLALPSSQRDRQGEVDCNVIIPNHDFKLDVSRSCFGTFSPQGSNWISCKPSQIFIYSTVCPSIHPSNHPPTHASFYILSTECVGPNLCIIFSTSYIFNMKNVLENLVFSFQCLKTLQREKNACRYSSTMS